MNSNLVANYVIQELNYCLQSEPTEKEYEVIRQAIQFCFDHPKEFD